MIESFFDGLTVIELGDQRNQYIGKLLSDGGAEVIQIEPPKGGAARWSGPFVDDKPDPNKCLDYWYYNTGKKSICLDLAAANAVDVVKRLAQKADIVLQSMPPSKLQQSGLGYPELRKVTGDSLIYASITDFGLEGPWAEYQMNDIAHLALGGPMASSGYSDLRTTPIGGQGHQAWHIAGALCLHAITIALMERLSSGQGQFIDCSMHDCVSICTEGSFPAWVYDNRVLYRHTGQHAAAQRQASLTEKAADGTWVITMGTQLTPYIWSNLLSWMKEEGVAGGLDDPKYMDDVYRAQQFRDAPEIRNAMAALVAKLPAEEAMRRAQDFGMAWAVIRAPEENYDDPHWAERGYFIPMEHPEVGKTVRYPRGPYLSNDALLTPRDRAPLLGEHTAEILARLEREGTDAQSVQTSEATG